MAFEVGAISGRLELDRTPFQESLRAARAEARRFSDERITPSVHLADDLAKAQLDRLRLQLARLDHERVHVKVDVDKSALSTIERFFGGAGRGVGGIPFIGGLLSLPFKGVELLLSGLQKLPGLLESVGKFAATAFQTIAGTINDLRTGATTVGQVLGSIVSGLVSVVATGGTTLLAIGALVVVFGALSSVVISLVAALAALAASLAAAAAGAGALFIGAFAAAIPVLGVLVAFFTRFAAVLQAHKAAQQAAAQAAQQHKQALQAQHQAAVTLAQAQTNLKDQTVAAYAAMKQSVVDYQHALLGVEQAKLGIEGARLSLRQAKQDLRDFLHQLAPGSADQLFKSLSNVAFSPESAGRVFRGAGQSIGGDQLLQLQEKLYAVKQATLGIKSANQGYQDSLSQLAAAEQKRNAYLQEGIKAYKPYDNAVRQVASAHDQLMRATNRVSSASIVYHQRLKALSATEQGFLGTLTRVEASFVAIAKLVAAPIFKGIESALGSISKLLTDTGIKSGLVGIGKAIGSVVASFGHSLSTKPWRDAIKTFIDAGAQLTRSGGKLFTGFLTVLREIARAALPHVINGVKSLAGWFTDLGKRPGAIKSAVEFLVHQFHIWWGVAKALGGLVVAFMRNAAGAGGKLAGHLAHILNHWTDWLNTHPDAVRKFFDQAVTSTKHLLDNLGGIAKAMKTIADIINAPNAAGKWLGQQAFGSNPSDEHALSDLHTVDAALAAIRNRGASFTSRVNAGLYALQLAMPRDYRDEIRKALRDIGYQGAFDHPPLQSPRGVRHGAPAPRTPFAHGSSVVQNFHVHGITDPEHMVSKLAGKLHRHPAFDRAQGRETQRRGKSR